MALATPIFTLLLISYATLILSLLMVGVSVIALKRIKVYQALVLHPSTLYSGKQWYRTVSAGFVHSGFQNLLINGLLLLILGSRLEYFLTRSDRHGHLETAVIFLTGVISSNLISAFFHRKDFYYNSTGASAGVLAVMISYLLYNPTEHNLLALLGFTAANWLIVPIYITGLAYLTWKRPGGKISHELHLLGSLAGVFVMITLHPALLNSITKRSASTLRLSHLISYQSPAQLGPVAAEIAPINAPTPPNKPPTVAVTAIEAAHFPESMPPSMASISSIEYFLIKNFVMPVCIGRRVKTLQNRSTRVTPEGLT